MPVVRVLSLFLPLFAASSLWAIAADAKQIKIATVMPGGSAWMQAMRAASSDIKTQTDGRVVIKFYAGGVMGNDKKVLRKIRIGQLQGGVFTANGLSDRYRDILIYGLPLVFQSQAEVDYVRGIMDPVLTEGLDKAGFVSFGFAGGGFAKFMGNKPVRSIEDLRGRKVWVPEGDAISYEAMVALDLSPVVLPITDVLTGLQTGLLEYIATPPVGAVVLQWYTKVKYVSTLPIAYAIATMVIDKRAFGALSEADQAIVRERLSAVYQQFDEQQREDNRQAEDALAANGLQFVDPDSELVPLLREAANAANLQMGRDGVFSAELLEQMLAHLKEFRSGAESKQAAVSSPSE
jgi:TRAP-type C4-dicarboxylate transport system substrate-binding protein